VALRRVFRLGWPIGVTGLAESGLFQASALMMGWIGTVELAALFLIMDAMQVIALGLLRGVQDTRVPMWLAAVSYWGIGIPCSYVLAFPLGLGGVGLWLGLVVGLLFAASLLMARFWARRWRPTVGIAG
jgi:multidrug resistance protein, MATE family